MARLGCECGELMWNGLTPNDLQFWVYSDRKMDKIRENDIIDVIELSSMEDYEVWLCPKCKRLYIFVEGNTKGRLYRFDNNGLFRTA